MFSLTAVAKGGGGFDNKFEDTICRIKAEDHSRYYFQIYRDKEDVYVNRVEVTNDNPVKVDFSEENLKAAKKTNKLDIRISRYTEVNYQHQFHGRLFNIPGETEPKNIILVGERCFLWTIYFDSTFDYYYTFRDEVEDPGLRDGSRYDAKKPAILLEVQKLLSEVELQ